MKRKSKGFTLVELLAVIVVLAIIIIIATLLVNRQIKKAKQEACEINKEMIEKSVKACLVENQQDECDMIEKLKEKGYLEADGDPCFDDVDELLEENYAILINDEKTDAKVITIGNGANSTDLESPPDEYFSWCNSAHTCIDGLTQEGKDWLQKHDDILVIPDNVITIKNCQASSSDCESFSEINIATLLATNKKTKISANFRNSIINTVKIDGGIIENAKFQNTRIKKLILGNTSPLSVINYAFVGSTIDYFKIESGQLNWQAFTSNTIGTLEIGKDVSYIGGNLFNGATINKLIFNSAKITSSKNYYQQNPPFRAKINEIEIGDNVTIILKNFFAVDIGQKNATLKKITIGKNVKTIEPWAFTHHVNNGSGCGHGTYKNCLFTKIDGTYITQEEYDTNPSYYLRQGYCLNIFCEISSIEEIIIKGDPNRFDDVWNKIPFPKKETIEITTK